VSQARCDHYGVTAHRLGLPSPRKIPHFPSLSTAALTRHNSFSRHVRASFAILQSSATRSATWSTVIGSGASRSAFKMARESRPNAAAWPCSTSSANALVNAPYLQVLLSVEVSEPVEKAKATMPPFSAEVMVLSSRLMSTGDRLPRRRRDRCRGTSRPCRDHRQAPREHFGPGRRFYAASSKVFLKEEKLQQLLMRLAIAVTRARHGRRPKLHA
jgi:hypothetical protein